MWTSLGVALLIASAWPSVHAVALDDSRTYTRACEDSVHGELDEDWRDSSIVIGRLAFVGARDYRDAPSRWFRKRRDGTYRTHKIMIQIENGADMTVRIPKPHRRKSALAYDPALFNERLRIRDADYEVIFDVCANVVENPHRADVTQYNGGFVVARARCVPVNVLNGEGERIKRIRISFGAGSCTGATADRGTEISQSEPRAA